MSSSKFHAVFGPLGDEFADRIAADAQAIFDPLDDIRVPGQHGLQTKPADGAEFVDGFQIERIAGGDEHPAVLSGDRQQRMPEHHRRRELAEQFGIDLDFLEFDVPHAQFIGEGGEGLLFGDQAHIHSDLIEPPPVGLAAGQFDLLLIQQSAIVK